MKLSICVPHYNEDYQTFHYLFDSIALQRGIDFKEIEVLVGNDGSDQPIEGWCHEADYPFKIRCFTYPHRGVSATRNSLLYEAKGRYVMFCDCDDGFCQAYGLHLLFARMKSKPDVIISSFIEEGWQGDKFVLIRHDNDMQFIHGKAYSKKFLASKDIRFKEELLVHEDGYFNNLVGTEAKSFENIENPFYVWRWNENSVGRKEEAEVFLMKTYPDLMATREAICTEFKKRGFVEEYYDAVAKTIIDAYYEFQKPIYYNKEYHDERIKAKDSVRAFLSKYQKDFEKCSVDTISEIMDISRKTAYKRGMKIENITLNEFLDIMGA